MESFDKAILGTIDMPSSVSSFEHEPLTNPEKQIRLFRLYLYEDGIRLNTICGHVHTFWLDGLCPEFVALSYEWGSHDTQDIMLGESRLAIRTNLGSFLHSLRRWQQVLTEKSTNILRHQYLWIDQICIDQSSPIERNHQVRLMSTIFSTATCVVAWLGANLNITQYDGYDTTLNDDASPLLSASYFQRLWVQQELLLARRILFCLGEVFEFWEDLRTRSCFTTPGYDIPAILELLLHKKDSARPRLFRAIQQFSHCQCADPRDRVYGLLGMIGDNPSMDVDYTLTSTRVLHATVERVLKLEMSDYGVKPTLVKLAKNMGLAGEVEYVKSCVQARYCSGNLRKARTELEGMYERELDSSD